MTAIRLLINNSPHDVDVAPDTALLWVLRDNLSLTGTKAEVSIVNNKSFKIDRTVAAVDCGRAINPESVRSQTEGAITYSLSAALKNAITIKNGAVEQANVDGYDPIRMNEAPPIDVYIVESDQDPGGMGKPGLPPLAPAIANAIFAASGQRLRRLPFEFKPAA